MTVSDSGKTLRLEDKPDAAGYLNDRDAAHDSGVSSDSAPRPTKRTAANRGNQTRNRAPGEGKRPNTNGAARCLPRPQSRGKHRALQLGRSGAGHSRIGKPTPVSPPVEGKGPRGWIRPSDAGMPHTTAASRPTRLPALQDGAARTDALVTAPYTACERAHATPSGRSTRLDT